MEHLYGNQDEDVSVSPEQVSLIEEGTFLVAFLSILTNTANKRTKDDRKG